MQFKPHLLMNPSKGTIKMIFVDEDKVQSKESSFDNLEKIARSKYSPIKCISISTEKNKKVL